MSKKPNKFLEDLEAKYERHYRAEFHIKCGMLLQMAQDCACVAADEVLGMPSEKAEDFCRALADNVNELAHYMVTDQNDDPEFVHSKNELDKRLLEIIPEDKFLPYEERYGDERLARIGGAR